jgi:hypothetical protein
MLRKLNCYLARVGIFLIVSAMIAGAVACNGDLTGIRIGTWYDLDAVRGNLTGSYILMNDLDSATPGYDELASSTANGGKGWQPIGSRDAPFAGSFDGQGHGRGGGIFDLFINRPNEDDVGLFSAVGQSGVIKNMDVTNVTVIGQGIVGGVAGFNGGTVSNLCPSSSVTGNLSVGGLVGVNEGTVTKCYSTGSVTGGESVGGLVGTNVGTVSNSGSTSSVTGSNYLIGGLVGVNEGTVTNCYSMGNVAGNLGVGGLVGANGNSGPGTVINSRSHGRVTGESYVGGLVGANTNEASTVSNSYSTGSVAGNLSVGGLVGVNEGSTVTHSYSIGNVTGNTRVGGLVGFSKEGTVTSSFWDIQTSGQATSGGGTGKTTAKMQDVDTFSRAAWDIATVSLGEHNPAYIWNIVNGLMYPYLSW